MANNIITDKEFKALDSIIISLYLSIILFPGLCLLLIVFGYHSVPVMILQGAVLLITIIPFIRRTIFLKKYPHHQLSLKRFNYETISWICCLLFAIGTALLVSYHVDGDTSSLEYYPFNIYVMPAFLIFTVVLSISFIRTAKHIHKAWKTEYDYRQNKIEKELLNNSVE